MNAPTLCDCPSPRSHRRTAYERETSDANRPQEWVRGEGASATASSEMGSAKDAAARRLASPYRGPEVRGSLQPAQMIALAPLAPLTRRSRRKRDPAASGRRAKQHEHNSVESAPHSVSAPSSSSQISIRFRQTPHITCISHLPIISTSGLGPSLGRVSFIARPRPAETLRNIMRNIDRSRGVLTRDRLISLITGPYVTGTGNFQNWCYLLK